MRHLLFAILFLLALSTNGACLEITFKQSATVSANQITLGDIAVFNETSPLAESLATWIVSRSPEPGELSQLSAERIIKDIIRKNDIAHTTVWLGSAAIEVKRSGQSIDHTHILRAIQHFLDSKKAILPKAEISFIPKRKPLPFLVPEGELSWEVIASNPNIIDSSRFAIILKVDGRVRKNISVSGRLQALAPVAVATKTLNRGSILTPANTRLEKRDILELDSPCLSMRTILGKRLKHGVKAGTAIDNKVVEHPPLIAKGQIVKIIIHQGPLFLSASGIARMSGKLNEIIRVQNLSSKKLILCKVTAPGVVEVMI